MQLNARSFVYKDFPCPVQSNCWTERLQLNPIIVRPGKDVYLTKMSATRNKKNSSSSSSSNGDNDVPTYDIDPAMLENEFVSVKAKNPLRVCCYGSSSSKTPAKFLKEAWNLGYILARRGHTCVNGAGSYGCMVSTMQY